MYRQLYRGIGQCNKSTVVPSPHVSKPIILTHNTCGIAIKQRENSTTCQDRPQPWMSYLSKPWSIRMDLASSNPCCVRSLHQMFYHVGIKNNVLEDVFKGVMSQVPQPVVIVTAARTDEMQSAADTHAKRGVTCSSFTSISLSPAIISFAVTTPSRMHQLLEDVEKFAVHVLAKDQVNYAVHFAKPAIDGQDQFEGIPHEITSNGIPILRNACAVLHCRTHAVTTIGDHHVWYGEVEHAYQNDHGVEPLLYYARSFRSIGDETFMQAFEDTSLPFQDWTHEAHIRMAWNYITEYGKEKAAPLIKQGILRYNEQHKEEINRGYHETITQFYINIIAIAIIRTKDTGESFEIFLSQNSHLTDRHLPFNYYSDQVINSAEARHTFIKPDLQQLS